jgi:hypothetical protein
MLEDSLPYVAPIYMMFLFVGFVSFTPRLPSDGPSRFHPCLRLVLVSMYKSIDRIQIQGFAPHKFTPVPGAHQLLHSTREGAARP